MDDLFALPPAVLVPALAAAWFGAAAVAAITVGRAVHLADQRATQPVTAGRGRGSDSR